MLKDARILDKTNNQWSYYQIDDELIGQDFYNFVEIPDDGNLYVWNGTDAVIDTAITTNNTKLANNANIYSQLDNNQQKYLRALVRPGYKYSANTADETYNASFPQGLTWAEYYASQDQVLRAQLQ